MPNVNRIDRSGHLFTCLVHNVFKIMYSINVRLSPRIIITEISKINSATKYIKNAFAAIAETKMEYIPNTQTAYFLFG